MMDWWNEAEQKLGVSLRRHTTNQAVGPCPHCGEGDDRLVVFVEGNYWCRVNGHQGWWKNERPGREELAKAKQKERQRKMELYEQMHLCKDWLIYHRETPTTYEVWMDIGFTEEEVNKWGLGWCKSCPLSPEHSSLTIPIWYRGKLWDIRHRLQTTDEDSKGKYRSHLSGITPPFFNLDSLLSSRQVYVMEGEKKCIKGASCGLQAIIGYPGIQFAQRLLPIFNKHLLNNQQIIFIPDPGTTEKIVALANQLKTPCFLVDLWKKPDDFILDYGEESFLDAIKIPRPL